MNGAQGGSLQNVLSISTAANNRYLLHFNTLNSLTQWTAGIRLAMFEHCTLQEAYTGSLIAGKGRNLNNIKQIMFPLKFAHEDWARVRFGAGTPWRRCWCVISPPEEKELDKAKKAAKKASPYERVKMPRGGIKFYDTKKVTKKTRPIATVSEAFAAYAIYPQSKPLIEQSTLVKVEGVVTIHGFQEPTEGFVFVMPEVHQAVTGFEIMLRWLIPAFDTFNLYGRPTKLIADKLDQRGLMFAMPSNRRYGYLDILDVSGLIHTRGSQGWTERQWRRELKKLTAERMMNQVEGTPRNSSQGSRRRNTANDRPGVRFGDAEAARSTPGSRSASPSQQPGVQNRYPPESAPPGAMNTPWSPHKRAQSEAQGLRKYMTESPSRLSYEHSRPDSSDGPPPPPPPHSRALGGPGAGRSFGVNSLERIQSGSEIPDQESFHDAQEFPPVPTYLSPPTPVSPPPAFTHQPNSRPINEPYAPPDLRRANSNVDAATLQEMREAMLQQQESTYEDETWNGVVPQRQQNMVPSNQLASRGVGVSADRSQGAVNRMQHIQRLSTIPASPFVGSEAEHFQSPEQTSLVQMEGVVDDPRPASQSEITQPENRAAPPVPLHSSQSITRKPVPWPLPQAPETDERPPISRSLTDPTHSPLLGDSWEHMIINEVALEQQLTISDRASSMKTTTTESTEPDYASTASASTKGKRSLERPRVGKLKTVGNADIPSINDPFGELDTNQAVGHPSSSEIPDVNFGPTYDYTRMIGTHPRASRTPGPEDNTAKRRSVSADRLLQLSQSSPGDTYGDSTHSSPRESKRLSYFDGGRTPTPGGTPTPSGHRTPEPLEDRVNVMWPGASPPRALHRSQTSLTPEEWVQQRAAMAQQPQYAPPKVPLADRFAHGRSSSVQNPSGRRKLTKTPPLSRHLSGEWGRQTPPPRPSSRGAGINLDTAGQSFSATEQMQFSRATGSPLINLAQNSNKQPDMAQPGLVGAVAQRERDRIASKEGRNSMLVQQAIERQQQQQRMEAEAQAQRQYEMQMRQQAQQQQQMNWNQQMYMQNQQYAPQMPQTPLYQYQTGYPPSASSQYSSATGYFGQGQQQQQQAYGSGYLAQQQQQYGRR